MTIAPGRAPRAVDPEVERAVDEALPLLRGRIAVLTGAGVSTDSGIPDYRGRGAPKRTPMTIQQFLSAPSFRQRYWAGSYVGWARFVGAEPNEGHLALADLEAASLLTGVVTQNVDGLHGKAGSRHVVEVHGAVDRVLCLDCGQTFARSSIAERIEAANPVFAGGSYPLNPDGDADVGDTTGFVVPDCTVCGGVLKPDVVFFGERVPPERVAAASALVASARSLLVLGSSLTVMSGFRFVLQAAKRSIPVAIVNEGATRGDAYAAAKVEAPLGAVLSRLAAR
jgi:NAD-dependent SIR2 family protein deacetylase